MKLQQPHYLLYSEASSSAERRGDRTGQWHFVLESIDGEEQFEAGDEECDAQGERLELLAVVRGLEALDQPSKVTLVTPSRYVTRGLRNGIPNWRESGWMWERFGEMAPIKNDDLWKRVDRAMDYHKVECRFWRFDASHSLNDQVEDPDPAKVDDSTVRAEDAHLSGDAEQPPGSWKTWGLLKKVVFMGRARKSKEG